MAKKSSTKTTSTNQAIVRAYTSPTLVLLAMDWADGANHEDFLGFAILRDPGFQAGEQDGYLLNKIGFAAPGPQTQSLPSNVSPIQKFLWWDSAITSADRGKTFTYTVTPVTGTGATDLTLNSESASDPLEVLVPEVSRDGISTWFNRAVVSSQAFSREFPDPEADLDKVMDWLANGLEDAFVDILKGAKSISGAIYHLTDNEWVVPDLKTFPGDLSMVYEFRKNDQVSVPAINILKRAKSNDFVGFKRSKTNIMHNKFLVDETGGRVLMGSANYTPEGLTSQANLLHIFDSPELANLFSTRQKCLQNDPSVKETAQGAAWSDPIQIGKAQVRVYFSPAPANDRDSIETVIESIKAAKQSVIFCMFDPTDRDLLKSLLAVGDDEKLLYGMLNSISDPNRKKGSKKSDDDDGDLTGSGEPSKDPSPATQIKVTLFNRSQKDKKVLAYSYFHKGDTPAGFLPELSAVDMNSKSTVPPKTTAGKGKGGAPAVHIHHKFIVIDAETDSPIIYTGSNNLSNNSTYRNDENLLEIKGSPELAQTYFAEFMRLYEHFRARALWNMANPSNTGRLKQAASMTSKLGKTFTLKTTRDEWVRGGYKKGTAEYLARTALADTE